MRGDVNPRTAWSGVCPRVSDVALFQELSGQGRVVGGHLSSGSVLAGGATLFSKNSDLSIQHASNPFKRHKINAETVAEWEELDAKEGVAGAMSRAAAKARSREWSAGPSGLASERP